MVSVVYSVTQLTRHIKALIDDDETLHDLVVEGEVSNPKRAASGHCYFTLKDSESEVHCVMWRGIAQRYRLPEQGTRVRVRGYVSVYERGGSYQLYVNQLHHVGDGLLWQAFLELKERLRVEGLFDEGRKRPLPRWPKLIGVVTSPTAAGFQDMLNVLSQRFPLVAVVLSPTLVQGPKAPEGIVRAFQRLERRGDIDVIILGRGGGSLEDLWAFNDESVARAIVACSVPVVTGIGHETDFTIADFCADVWAPTPTAAAAVVVPDVSEVRDALAAMKDRLVERTTLRLDAHWERLETQKRLLGQYSPERQFSEYRQRIDDLTRRMMTAVTHLHDVRHMSVESATARLQALDPRLVLGRGYAIVRDEATGAILRDAAKTGIDRELAIRLYEGHLSARVIEVFTGK